MTLKFMRVSLNGESREVTNPTSVAQLVITLGLKPEQVAVELNHIVIRRASWENTQLQDDDKIEIVHFVGGG